MTTYTFHLQFSEQASSHEHAQGDGEYKDKWQAKGGWAGFNDPEGRQTHHLDYGEQVHPASANLQQKCGGYFRIRIQQCTSKKKLVSDF